MAGAAVNIKKYTVEEYLVLDSKSESKLEFFDGKIIEMPGGTTLHNQIAARIIAALVNLLDQVEKEYIVYSSDMKIHIPAFNHFVYPDAVVVCEKPEFWEGRKDVIINPVLVVEILSPSTEQYDRGSKFFEYRTLPSFKEYLLVSQEIPRITSFYREKVDTWKETEAEGIEARLPIRSLDCELSLEQIFKKIRFEE